MTSEPTVKKKTRSSRLLSPVYCALFAVIITICSYITIPFTIPFTLQTLGIFLTLLLLGGKRGTLSVTLYLLLGCIGVPVFSGFRGGIGVLLSNTGGYIAGFLLVAFIYWACTALFGNKFPVKLLSLLLGLFFCYLFGTLWFYFGYTNVEQSDSVWSILLVCVVPFLIPDFIKLGIALSLAKILQKALPEELKESLQKSS